MAKNSVDQLVLSVEQVRRVDHIAIHEYGMSGLVLMENAGANVARLIQSSYPGQHTASIIAGVGNNGGDGLVIARHLDYFGWNVEVWMVGDEQKLSADCRSNLEILQRSKWNIHWIDASNELDRQSLMKNWNATKFIIDAMLGTGATGEPRYPMNAIIEAANECGSIRLAIDQPTVLTLKPVKLLGSAFKR